MHVSYYYKKVKIPTYIYNGGEGEEALFFYFLVFFSVYVYMSDKSTVKIDSILYPYLHTCFHLYTNTKKNNKKKKQLPSFRSTSSHLSTSWLNCFKSFHKK
jgi:hypothetical protein